MAVFLKLIQLPSSTARMLPLVLCRGSSTRFIMIRASHSYDLASRDPKVKVGIGEHPESS